MTTPKFINSLFLRNLLESHYAQKEVVIKKHTIESKSGYVYHINIKYSSQQSKESMIGLIALVKPTESSPLINKEFTMLSHVLPRYVDAIRSTGTSEQLAPKIVYSVKEPNEVIILEDLAQNGYTAARISKGLTIEQSHVAVQKIATFHAASVVALQKASADVKATFAIGSLHSGTTFFEEAFTSFLETADAIKIPPSVVQKLTALRKPLLETSASDYGSSLNGFTVLNHGNVWTNNILFKYKNGEPVDALLIDFKRAVIGSPLLDLMFLFTTSVAYDVVQDYKDELLYAYHSTLSETLKALNYEGAVPTLLDIHKEFLQRGIFELLLTLTVAPYLRTPNCAIQPKIVSPILTEAESQVNLKELSRSVLATHGEDIIEELNIVEHNGLLDWGVDKSHIKKLLLGFQ